MRTTDTQSRSVSVNFNGARFVVYDSHPFDLVVQRRGISKVVTTLDHMIYSKADLIEFIKDHDLDNEYYLNVLIGDHAPIAA